VRQIKYSKSYCSKGCGKQVFPWELFLPSHPHNSSPTTDSSLNTKAWGDRNYYHTIFMS
jgi:hypothetical protein